MTLLLLATGVRGVCNVGDNHKLATYWDSCTANDRPVFFYYHRTSKNSDFKVRLDNHKVEHPVGGDPLGAPQVNGVWSDCHNEFTSMTSTPSSMTTGVDARLTNSDT